MVLSMVARTRIRTLSPHTGGYGCRMLSGTILKVSDGVQFPGGQSACDDHIDGTRNDHFLSINHRKAGEYGRVNGRHQTSPTSYREFRDYIPEFFVNYQGPTGHLPLPVPSDASVATTAKARTNPSRAVVSLPMAIGEMKDLPGLVKYLGKELITSKKTRKNFHQHVGNAWLSGMYGIAPMISDIQKLLDFETHVARRTNELERLHSKGGLRRRIEIVNESITGPKTTVFLESAIASVAARRQDVTTIKKWATVRWLPLGRPPSGNGNDTYRNQAKGVILGLRRTASGGLAARNDAWSDLSDIYNLMPWSWMIDWFSNMGDYIDSNRNTIPAQSSRINVMTTSKTTRTFSPAQSNADWIQLSNTTMTLESKSRTQQGGSTISADFQFLSGNQMSILGALAAQRLRIR